MLICNNNDIVIYIVSINYYESVAAKVYNIILHSIENVDLCVLFYREKYACCSKFIFDYRENLQKYNKKPL